MKRNLLLTAILAGLLTYTYYQDRIQRRKVVKTIFAKTISQNIQLKNVKLINKGGMLLIEGINYPASKVKVGALLERLNKITVKRVITGKDRLNILANDLFSNSISFSFEEVKYEVSRVNKITGKYFLWNKKTDEIFEAIDGYINEGFFRTELEADIMRYENLISFLSAKYQFFLKSTLPLADTFKKSVKFVFTGKNSFQLDLQKKTTFPEVLKGVYYDLPKMESYTRKFSEVEVIDLLKMEKRKDLKEVVSSIRADEEVITYYRTLANNPGHFVTLSNNKEFIFQISPKSSKIFNIDHQYFWKKNLNILSDIKKNIWLDLKINYVIKSLNLNIRSGEKLQIKESNLKKINSKTGNELLSLLSGLKPIDRVRDIDTGSKYFDLVVGQKKYTVSKTNEFFIIGWKNLFYYYKRSFFSTNFSPEEFFDK